MNLKNMFVTVLAVFLALNSYAENENNKLLLSVEDAVSLAKENNISIKTAKNSLKNLETVNRYSWNSVAPSANLRGDFNENLEDNASSYGITGSVSMSLSSNLYSSIQAAKLNYKKGLLSYEEAERTIELNVRKSFYKIILDQEKLKLKKRNLSTSYEQYQNNQEKFKNGKISELDAFTSRVNYESKKPDVEDAETTLINEMASFKQILGIPLNQEIELKGNLDSVLKMKAVSVENLPKVQEEAPDVQKAEYDVDIAKNQLLSSRFSAYGPTVTGGYSYGKSKGYSGNETTTNQLSLGVNIPLDGALPWSTKSAQVKANKNALNTAELNLENTKTSVAVQTESYIRKINQALSMISSLKETEQLASKTYEMSKTAYNYGKTDLLTLQSASDAVLNAGVNLKSQAYTLLTSVLELEDLLGLKFGTLEK